MNTSLTNGAYGRIDGPEPQAVIDAALLDVKGVAALLGGCSTRHVYRLVDSGRMPHPVKLGALVRRRRAELEAWIEEGCKPTRTSRGSRG